MSTIIETIEQLKDFLNNKRIKFIHKEFSNGTINLVTHDYCLIRDNLKYDILKIKNQKLLLSTINQEKAYKYFATLFEKGETWHVRREESQNQRKR